MNIGLYFDLRNPPQWRQDPGRLHSFTLELCEEAERQGIHSIWVTEHHMFEDGYLTQPLLFLAAVAARTKKVRLGTAILLAPLHSAVEIAEQAALVDLISDGRLDLGLGAGYRVPEFELYGADLKTRYSTTDKRASQLRKIWEEGILTPMPVQKRLPIWMGYNGPQGARRAGLLGECLLSPEPSLYEPYRQGLIDAGHDPAIARMSGAIQCWVTNDPEKEWNEVSRHIGYHQDSYRRYLVEGTNEPMPRPVDPNKFRARDIGKMLGYYLFDTPENIALKIKSYTAGAPVETIFFWASIAGMREELVIRHVETICKELVPLMRDVVENPPFIDAEM